MTSLTDLLTKLKCKMGFHKLNVIERKEPVEQLFTGGFYRWYECTKCKAWKFERWSQ